MQTDTLRQPTNAVPVNLHHPELLPLVVAATTLTQRFMYSISTNRIFRIIRVGLGPNGLHAVRFRDKYKI